MCDVYAVRCTTPPWKMKLKINKDQNFCDIHADSECIQTSNHNCICVMRLLTQLVYSYILMSPNFIVKVRKKNPKQYVSFLL